MSSKKIKTGHLSLDPYENAINVEYEVTVTGSDGGTEVTQKETKVRLKPIKPDTNLQKLAGDIINKCKYISEKKYSIVEQLVFDLRRRQFQDDDEEEVVDLEVSLDKIDDYMEQLYGGEDDLPDKIKGSASILQLCKSVGNLETLIQNMQLMSALSRVLADDYKRSSELSFNLVRVFLSFSNFMEMHSILANYKVGAMTMKVVELEIKRSDHRKDEREKSIIDGEKISSSADRKDRTLSKRQDKLLFVALHLLINLAEDVSVEKKMAKKNMVKMLTQCLDRKSPDCAMLVVTFLRKLSIFADNMKIMGDPDTNTIYHIAKYIPCSHDKLTTAALRLLFNLSFNKECRQRMVEAGMLKKLVNLLKKAPFRAKTIKILYHLSSDASTSALLPPTDFTPILMQLIINFPHNIVAKELASLAVNVSFEPGVAEQMADGSGLRHLMSRVGEYGDVLLAKVVRNISLWTFNEQRKITKITEHVEVLKENRKRAMRAERAMHRLAEGGGGGDEDEKEEDDDDTDEEDMADLPRIPAYMQRRLWGEHLQHLIKMSLDCDSHDLLVELLGTLGNLTEQDCPKGKKWSSLMKEFNLTSFLSKLLVPGMSQNDVVLECIILIGQMCVDEKASVLLASSSLIRALHDLWQDKSDDSEIVLQLLTAFHRMLHFPETREELLYSTEAMADISECVGSKHRGTREVAEKCLELILEYDRDENGQIGELGAQVRRRRFLAHNKEWVEDIGGPADVDREDRVYRHGNDLDSDDDLMGGETGHEWRHGDEDEDDEINDRDHFITGSGQKVAIDTSGLSSGVGDESGGSRDFDNTGWGQ
ncbi:hypothetical protein TrLO_g4274 [Triparma laevis f. longispina]|uniref:Kinesin-associated protein 3 n=1 Tax=Triparma laevis f. longispina TaxID=1714387 RepID=A0A9W7DVN7_9STRA|nr:hypothetical protein TrLO_g4274 [Triparma laevis f. longispina]